MTIPDTLDLAPTIKRIKEIFPDLPVTIEVFFDEPKLLDHSERELRFCVGIGFRGERKYAFNSDLSVAVAEVIEASRDNTPEKRRAAKIAELAQKVKEQTEELERLMAQ